MDVQTGKQIWDYPTVLSVLSSPAVADDKVFFGSWDKAVYCLDANTGSLVWRYRTDGPVLSSATIAGGLVFIGSDDWRIYALDEKTGNPVWAYKTGSNVKSTPAVVNGRLYVGSEDGYVYCFGQGEGILPQPSSFPQSSIQPYTIAASIMIAVAVVGSYLYVRLRKRGKKAET